MLDEIPEERESELEGGDHDHEETFVQENVEQVGRQEQIDEILSPESEKIDDPKLTEEENEAKRIVDEKLNKKEKVKILKLGLKHSALILII